MSPLRTLTLLASTTLLIAAASAPALDNSSIAPDASEMHKLLSARMPLSKAIQAAEESVSGRAREARYTDSGEVSVDVFSPTEHFEIVIDGAGAVKSKRSIARFPGAPVSGQWTELPSGLKYFDLVVGTGEKPAGPTARVKVHYTGWFPDGNKFDSSVDRGEPAVFGLNQVIKGWTEGVGSMNVGGKRKLIVPYELGYGVGGRPGIPPKSMLVFDVELLEIVK